MRKKIEIIRVNCEWDIGLEDTVFTSMEAAERLVEYSLKECGIEESREELEDEGLVNYEFLTVVSDE